MASRTGSEASRTQIRTLYWVCVAGFFTLLLSTIQRGFRGISDYSLEEWLISYPDHFMRRGIKGFLVMGLSHASHIGPYKIASFLVLILYGVTAVVGISLVFKWLSKNAPSFILPVLLSPAGLFFYYNCHNGAYRFDLAFVLITVAHVEICLRSKTVAQYTSRAILLFATAGVLAMLSSEVFLFVGIPINLALSLRRTGGLSSKTAAIFTIPLLAAAACFLHPGTASDAKRIYELAPIVPSVHGAVSFFGMSARDEARLVLDWTRTGGNSILALAILLLVGASLVLLRNIFAACESVELEGGAPLVPRPKIWRDLLLIPFVCTLPLYVLGYDCGRWASIVLAMFLLVVCRVTYVARPLKGLGMLEQVLIVVSSLVIAMPSHILAPTESLFDSDATALTETLFRAVTHQPKPESREGAGFAVGAANAYAAAPETTTDLLVAGDSIALFCPWSEYLGRPAMSRGIYGETSSELLARVPELARHKPQTLIVITGANDVRTGVPADKTLANIKALAASGIAPRIIVLGVCPGDAGILPPDQVKAVDEGLAANAASWGIEYVAPPAGYSALADTFDGLHPNGAGYKLIANKLRPLLVDTVDKYSGVLRRYGMRIESGPNPR